MNNLTKNCKACDKEFAKYPSDSKKYWAIKMFCSKKCANNTNKNYKKLVGIKRPASVVEKMRKTMFRKGQAPWNKGIPYLAIRGEKHHNWKGGISSNGSRRFIMTTLEYKNWRRAIFERDDYTCQFCGARGVTLNADHIKPWSLYPELRYTIDNGRTLCPPCHKTTDTYGSKALYYKF
uniref:Putative homing endonuclease n=1 Tax=viral metagenome TaxID=1070528 RepID=A0A6M3Y4D5_9ZZZZ